MTKNLLNIFVLLAIFQYKFGLCYAADPGAPPTQIVSMSLASDEILLTLAPKCGGYHRIAALSIFADDPKSSNVLKEATAIKGRVHSELESILLHKPDLVIGASFNRPEVIKALTKRKIKVLVLENFASALDIAKNISLIGDYIGCKTPAETLKTQFLEKLNSLAQKTDQTSPPRIINFSPDLIVMGKNTLFDDMVMRVGAVNVASQRGLSFWPKIDPETLLTLDPDVLVILEEEANKKVKEKQIKNHPVWNQLVTKRSCKLLFLEPKEALSTSHFFANAVEALKKKLQ